MGHFRLHGGGRHGGDPGPAVRGNRVAAHLPGRPGSEAAIDALLADQGAVGAIAHPLFTDYVVAFELTGILLLVAIVGALALAKRRV